MVHVDMTREGAGAIFSRNSGYFNGHTDVHGTCWEADYTCQRPQTTELINNKAD